MHGTDNNGELAIYNDVNRHNGFLTPASLLHSFIHWGVLLAVLLSYDSAPLRSVGIYSVLKNITR